MHPYFTRWREFMTYLMEELIDDYIDQEKLRLEYVKKKLLNDFMNFLDERNCDSLTTNEIEKEYFKYVFSRKLNPNYMIQLITVVDEFLDFAKKKMSPRVN
jgi:hypothetical protein